MQSSTFKRIEKYMKFYVKVIAPTLQVFLSSVMTTDILSQAMPHTLTIGISILMSIVSIVQMTCVNALESVAQYILELEGKENA